MLLTVFPSELWLRRHVILLIRSSTTSLTSSEKTATSHGRMMSCLSTLRILSQSSPSLKRNTGHETVAFGTHGPTSTKCLNDRWQSPKQTHAEMRPVERPLKSRYSCQDSMLPLWGATPSALSTSATRSRSATETTSWGPKWDLKILPYILLCSIWKTAKTWLKHIL